MSKTMRRNGTLVENSLRQLARESEFALNGKSWVSVGQVAQDTGFSRPTCRKYLDIMYHSECATRTVFMGAYIYAPAGS